MVAAAQPDNRPPVHQLLQPKSSAAPPETHGLIPFEDMFRDVTSNSRNHADTFRMLMQQMQSIISGLFHVSILLLRSASPFVSTENNPSPAPTSQRRRRKKSVQAPNRQRFESEESFDWKKCEFFILDEKYGILPYRAVKHAPYPFAATSYHRTLTKGTVSTNDVRTTGPHFVDWMHLYEAHNARALACFPLVLDGQTVGVATLASVSKDSFSTHRNGQLFSSLSTAIVSLLPQLIAANTAKPRLPLPPTMRESELLSLIRHRQVDADIDWGDFFLNLVSMCILYAYFSEAAVRQDGTVAMTVSLVVAVGNVGLLTLRWLWYERQDSHGPGVTLLFQLYRTIALPIVNAWMVWSILSQLGITPDIGALTGLLAVFAILLVGGIRFQPLLHAPLQLVSIALSAIATITVCSSQVACPLTVSGLQFILGFFLPTLCSHIADVRNAQRYRKKN